MMNTQDHATWGELLHVRSTRRENFSPLTPLSTTTRLEMHYSPSNNASAGRLNRDRSIVIRAGYN